jgi:hypothetical protein
MVSSHIMPNPNPPSFQKHHPDRILPFISCLNRTPSNIGNSLSYTLHCADRTKVNDFTTVIQPCAESQEGEQLLIESAKRCDRLKTHTSATIRIAGKNVCVRDGGRWKDCREVLSLGGGDVTLGLEKLIHKEWKKEPSRRVISILFLCCLLVGILANWSMGLNAKFFKDSFFVCTAFWEAVPTFVTLFRSIFCFGAWQSPHQQSLVSDARYPTARRRCVLHMHPKAERRGRSI